MTAGEEVNQFPDAKVNRAVDPSLIPDEPSIQLIERPYFRIGDAPNGDEEMYANLFDPDESDAASDYHFNSTLLATFIPAKQLASGGSDQLAGLPSSGENQRSFEMQSSFYNEGWYNNDDDNQENPVFWDHGDFKKIALPYVYLLYTKFIDIGELK